MCPCTAHSLLHNTVATSLPQVDNLPCTCTNARQTLWLAFANPARSLWNRAASTWHSGRHGGSARSPKKQKSGGSCEPRSFTFRKHSWKREYSDFHIIKRHIKALFSSKKFCKIKIVPLSFVFDKYYPNMY